MRACRRRRGARVSAASDPSSWLPIDGVLAVVVAWLAIGLAGLPALRRFRVVTTVLFPAGGVAGAVLAVVGVAAAF